MGGHTRGKSSPLRPRHEASGSFTTEEGEVRYPAHLRWICVRCTKSCRDLPGHTRNILLAQSDIKRITDSTKLTAKEFSISSRGSFPYIRKMRRLVGRCVFLQDSRCSIYRARPLICRFYPFSLHPARNNTFEIRFDLSCSGMGKGPYRDERFFRNLVQLANKELRP
jgi:Fe-S-cluster containining protein